MLAGVSLPVSTSSRSTALSRASGEWYATSTSFGSPPRSRSSFVMAAWCATDGLAASMASASASGPCQTAARTNAERSSSVFDKAIARVAVVVDAMLLFQLLDHPQIRFRVRAGDAVAERLARVEQDLLEA